MKDIDESRLYDLLGQRVRNARKKANPPVTQAALAKALLLKRTSVSNIEKGIQRPSLHILYRLCAFLRLEITELLPRYEDIELALSPTISEQEVKVGRKSERVPPKTSAFIRAATEPTELPEKTAAFVNKHKQHSGDRQ